MLGISLRDKIQNEEIRRWIEVINVIQRVADPRADEQRQNKKNKKLRFNHSSKYAFRITGITYAISAT